MEIKVGTIVLENKLGKKEYKATMVGYSNIEKEYGEIIVNKNTEQEKTYTSEKVVGTEQAPL